MCISVPMTDFEELYRYRVAKGLVARCSVVEEFLKDRQAEESLARAAAAAGGDRKIYRSRMVDMYEVTAINEHVAFPKITGPFRVSAHIPPTPAVVVAIPKTLRLRGDAIKASKVKFSKEQFAERSRVSASLKAHISNKNESYSASFPFRHSRANTISSN